MKNQDEITVMYDAAQMAEIEVGVREYAEKRREIYIDCAVEYAGRFNNFEDEETHQ